MTSFRSRKYVFRMAWRQGNWPTKLEWRFILLGRWPDL